MYLIKIAILVHVAKDDDSSSIKVGCLNFCQDHAEIRQSSRYVVRLIEAMPAESVRL